MRQNFGGGGKSLPKLLQLKAKNLRVVCVVCSTDWGGRSDRFPVRDGVFQIGTSADLGADESLGSEARHKDPDSGSDGAR